MTQIVHVANTNFEFELAHPSLQSLELSLSRHSFCLQLQFIPLLYAESEDLIAVTALPNPEYLSTLEEMGWWPNGLPQLVLLQEVQPFQGRECLSWGSSRQVQAWAEDRQMRYSIPNWQIVQLVNSKSFSFRYSCLQEATLINHEQALINWLQQTQGHKVLKTCFGLSGKGNWLTDENHPSSELLAFCQKEWQQKRPILAEPWLDRVCDFSTQWFIHSLQKIEYIGATRFETDIHGVYQATLAGSEEKLFASFHLLLEQHRQFALNALTNIAKMGFFGFVGVDALLYRHPQNQSIQLYPLVEINGRQTMSLVALRLQRRICSHQILRLSFEHKSSSPSFLPHQLVNAKGKMIHFRRALTATII